MINTWQNKPTPAANLRYAGKVCQGQRHAKPEHDHDQRTGQKDCQLRITGHTGVVFLKAASQWG